MEQLKEAQKKLKVTSNIYYGVPVDIEVPGSPDRATTTSTILYTRDKVPSMSQVDFLVFTIDGAKKVVNKIEYRKLMAAGNHFDSAWEAEAAKTAKVKKAVKKVEDGQDAK